MRRVAQGQEFRSNVHRGGSRKSAGTSASSGGSSAGAGSTGMVSSAVDTTRRMGEAVVSGAEAAARRTAEAVRMSMNRAEDIFNR